MKSQIKQKEAVEVVVQGLKPIQTKCNFCGKREGVISITDGETQRDLLICGICDYKTEWSNPRVEALMQDELTAEQEDYIIESGMEMARELK